MQLEMHVDAERVERLLHGELSPDEARAAHAHLESCASCRATVDAARSQEAEVLALLGTLDHTPPALDLAAVRVRRHRRWPLRWAAGFAFALVAAGTAYALPGSPLRAWIRSLVSRVSAVEASGGASPAAPTVSEPERQVAGVIVAPGERFRIDLLVGNAGAPPAERTTTAAGEVVVTLRDDLAEVVVQVPTGSASFDTREAGLSIRTDGAAVVVEIGIPRRAPFVEIHVGGRRWMVVEGGRVLEGSTAGPDGRYRWPLTP